MVDPTILTSAVRVLVSKEIEEAGRRVGARLAKAFGELAKTANDTIEIEQDVQRKDGAIIIRIAWDKQREIVEEALVEQAQDIEDDNDLESLSESLAADNDPSSPDDPEGPEPEVGSLYNPDIEQIDSQVDTDEQMIYTGEEEPAELQIDPSDIEMIEDGTLTPLQLAQGQCD